MRHGHFTLTMPLLLYVYVECYISIANGIVAYRLRMLSFIFPSTLFST